MGLYQPPCGPNSPEAGQKERFEEALGTPGGECENMAKTIEKAAKTGRSEQQGGRRQRKGRPPATRFTQLRHGAAAKQA